MFQLSELKESGREGATGKRNFVRNSYRYNVVFIAYFSAQQILTTTSIVNACFNSHRSSCDLNIENILFILIYLGSKNLSLKRNSHCRFIENKILFLIRLYIQILLYLDTMIYIWFFNRVHCVESFYRFAFRRGAPPITYILKDRETHRFWYV